MIQEELENIKNNQWRYFSSETHWHATDILWGHPIYRKINELCNLQDKIRIDNSVLERG